MQIEEFNVYTNKIKNITFAQISDMHLSRTKDNVNLKELCNTIKSINPTYIIITGDYFAGHKTKSFLDPKEKELLLDYLHELCKIAPIVMSLGNHDIKLKIEDDLRKEFLSLEEENIHPVDRTKSFVDEKRKINFIGYMQPKYTYTICDLTKKKRQIILEDINKYMPDAILPGYYNIGLIHTPIIARDKYLLLNDSPTKKLDLILSGHHHNGMVNYKFANRLDSLSNYLQNKFPKHKDKLEKIKYISWCESAVNKPIPFINFYARGMHMFGGVPTIISKGVGSKGAGGPNRKNVNNQVVTRINIINDKG